jgi:hypothetical protein
MVAPVAFFVATLIGGWRSPKMGHLAMRLVHGAMLCVILAQSLLIVHAGLINIQDGEYGLSCHSPHRISLYLAQHYAGGRILEDTYTSKIYGGEAGVDFKDFIYEGSSLPQWNAALADPARFANWVIVNTRDKQDIVGSHINIDSPAFLSQFTLVVQEPSGDNLYYRMAAGSLPTRPASADLLRAYQQCK